MKIVLGVLLLLAGPLILYSGFSTTGYDKGATYRETRGGSTSRYLAGEEAEDERLWNVRVLGGGALIAGVVLIVLEVRKRRNPKPG